MPTRTCVGCRKTDEQDNLIRVVADEAGRIRLGDSRRRNGRGAYFHPNRGCVEETMKTGGLQRSLKRRLVPIELEELWRQVEGMKEK